MLHQELEREIYKQRLTRKQLAKKAGISEFTLRSVLDGDINCKLVTYEKVANALGKSIRSKLVKYTVE